ncbi:hypothetical protein QE152_g19167 [Popillia japonica]|uniref:Uncharacterized protein n=1 Tax=Popillia japonica TaxID=7064 RepID=A0AAW1L3A8_POPJA
MVQCETRFNTSTKATVLGNDGPVSTVSIFSKKSETRFNTSTKATVLGNDGPVSTVSIFSKRASGPNRLEDFYKRTKLYCSKRATYGQESEFLRSIQNRTRSLE